MKNVDKKINTPILTYSLYDFFLEDTVFAQVFRNNHTIMMLVAPNEKQSILEANEAACNFYGYSHEQIIKLKMGDINTLSLIERQKKIKEAIRKPQSYYNFIHKTSSGVLKDVDVSASSISIKNKNVMFIIVHDITAQTRVESQLRENQERLSLALEGSNLGLWDWYLKTGELHVNERWAEMLGYSLDEIFPLSHDKWMALSNPEDLEERNLQLKKYIDHEVDTYKCALRMKHKNGDWIWVQTQGKVFEWDSNGKPLRMAGTHLDITEKKLIEIKLVESEERFRSFFEISPISLWEQDYSEIVSYINRLKSENVGDFRNFLESHPEELVKCSGMLKVLDVNPATLKMYEARTREQLFSNLDKIYTENSTETFKEKLISIYNNQTSFSMETIHKTFNGRKINVILDSILLPNLRNFVTITNITELKNKEYRLQELLSQTKVASETKEILLREINHRVKNNLSSLIGILYAEKKKSKNTLEKKQTDLLNNLINRVKGISIAHDLLSRSEWKPISIGLLSEKIINSLKHLIPSDRYIKTDNSQSSVFIDADQSQSMAIIINELFVNSLEHASLPGGTLKVDIKIIEKEGTVSYIYRDNGPGFSKEILALNSFNVGLYLIKNIVEQSLRGTISLKNKNGALIEIQFPGGGQIAEI